jgi:hypothetical protein
VPYCGISEGRVEMYEVAPISMKIVTVVAFKASLQPNFPSLYGWVDFLFVDSPITNLTEDALSLVHTPALRTGLNYLP